ncbi:MAG: PQQ-binding-like beta-propeller repeat protein [Planctomycetota bacterium]
MRKTLRSLIFCWLSSMTLLATSAADSVEWPQWRGPEQNGVAPQGTFPTEWSSDSGLAWKVDLPGRGGSTPVIAEGVAYLTAGIDGKNTLLAISLEDGKEVWRASLGNDTGGKHKKGSGSNPSAIVDGDSIFAYFRSGDLASVNTQGKTNWAINLQERFGEDTLWWDLGSSPTVTDDAVIVAVMQSGPSYLVALDKKTGDVKWKTDRMLGAPEEAAQSYSTPLHVSIDGSPMLAVMGADHITVHDAKMGKELGRLGGFNPDQEQYFRSISSPVAQGNIVVCPYARGATLTAVRLDDLSQGKGDQAIAWFRDDLGSDVPTPAAHNGRLYVVSDGRQSRGTVSCLDLESGKTVWTQRLPRSRVSFSSSPLVAGNHLYVTQEDGTTFVLGPLDANEPQVIAANAIDDKNPYTVASLVPLDGGFLLRSRGQLYRIGK